MKHRIFVKQGFISTESVPSLNFYEQDSREPECFKHDKYYWVVLEDVRFPDEYRVFKAKPYIWKGDVGEGYQEGYGWLDAHGNPWNNYYQGVNPLDNEQVILWLPC